jgi:hypothetical protein
MLTQRIGMFSYVELIMTDGEPRIFYDRFETSDDGREYKG